MKVLVPLLLLILFALPLTVQAAVDHTPRLMLANVYRPHLPVAQYWVSEKLDGVRAYWDGKRLITRGGYSIHAPEWFTAGFPSQPMDGELWLGRGRFQDVSTLVRSGKLADERWSQVQYMVFDLPTHTHNGAPASFEQRRLALQLLLGSIHISWLKPVAYFRLPDDAALQSELSRLVRIGGEGLMLNRADAPYRAMRSDALIKVKPRYDAEAIVIGHLAGKGKYTGMVGALLVRNDEGITFRVGSGLKDSDRADPPPVGATITYGYSGKTGSGKPRFPRFIRERLPE